MGENEDNEDNKEKKKLLLMKKKKCGETTVYDGWGEILIRTTSAEEKNES